MEFDSEQDDIFEDLSDDNGELFSEQETEDQQEQEATDRSSAAEDRGSQARQQPSKSAKSTDKERESAPEAAAEEGGGGGEQPAVTEEPRTSETDSGGSETQRVPKDWAEQEMHGPRVLEKGDLVEGTVVAVDDESIIVDVGAKQDGMIPRAEFPTKDSVPQRDSTIQVAVVNVDDEDGALTLSKNRADSIILWNELEQKAEKGGVVEAMVTDRVKGGLRADVGVPAFVPASHVATRNISNLDKFIGRSLRFKVLEANRRDKNVVLSHRELVEEEREKRRQQTLSELHEGAIVDGKVRNITNYGAFVDLGGIDGLLHVSEMSWGRVDHPSDLLETGQKIRVVVLDIEDEGDRISLGRRQILPDPWKETASELQTGSIVKAKITRIVRTGAFAQLLDAGIEGFIPIREMSDSRIGDPTEVLSEGQKVDLKIQQIRVKARRMTLSLIGAVQEKERREYEEYMAQQESGETTLGEQFGDVLESVREAEQEQDAGDGDEADDDDEAAEQPQTPDEAAPDEDEQKTADDSETTEEQQKPADTEDDDGGEKPDDVEDAGDDQQSAESQPEAADDEDNEGTETPQGQNAAQAGSKNEQ